MASRFLCMALTERCRLTDTHIHPTTPETCQCDPPMASSGMKEQWTVTADGLHSDYQSAIEYKAANFAKLCFVGCILIHLNPYKLEWIVIKVI